MRWSLWQTPAGCDWAFERWDWAKEHGFDFNQYVCVWKGESEETPENIYAYAEEIYGMLNSSHPDGYAARSMSMSDILLLENGSGYETYLYVDAFGFEDITLEMVG